jgi:hypothetical protein
VRVRTSVSVASRCFRLPLRWAAPVSVLAAQVLVRCIDDEVTVAALRALAALPFPLRGGGVVVCTWLLPQKLDPIVSIDLPPVSTASAPSASASSTHAFFFGGGGPALPLLLLLALRRRAEELREEVLRRVLEPRRRVVVLLLRRLLPGRLPRRRLALHDHVTVAPQQLYEPVVLDAARTHARGHSLQQPRTESRKNRPNSTTTRTSPSGANAAPTLLIQPGTNWFFMAQISTASTSS